MQPLLSRDMREFAYFLYGTLRSLSLHTPSHGGRDGYPQCRQIACKARRAPPYTQKGRPYIAVPKAAGRGGACSASHRRISRGADVRAAWILTMSPSDIDDPNERDRERAAAVGLWIAFVAFAILGSIWFMLFRL